tara:strand:- start:756 stop:980 length:225 start_codon:yes stop_codon:yes gene_type:complete
MDTITTKHPMPYSRIGHFPFYVLMKISLLLINSSLLIMNNCSVVDLSEKAFLIGFNLVFCKEHIMFPKQGKTSK